MVQVFPEIALGYLILKILVRGRHHPHVNSYVLVTADPGELALLQHTQHLGLSGKAHVPDLVQEKSPAVSLLELTLVLLDGRGESAFLVAEQFTFNQFRRDGRTVHLDVRHRASGTLLVETPRNQLLARTVGADDQHTGVSRGDLRNDVALMPDRL